MKITDERFINDYHSYRDCAETHNMAKEEFTNMQSDKFLIEALEHWSFSYRLFFIEYHNGYTRKNIFHHAC